MKKKWIVLVFALLVSLGSMPSVKAMGDVGYPHWGEPISCGEHYTAVLTADGSLWMWGATRRGSWVTEDMEIHSS